MPYQYQQPVYVQQVVAPKIPALGVLASFFIPGLGSMINGKGGKGALILVSYFVAWLTTIVIIGWVAVPAVWIWGMIAGYQDAQKWNRGHGIIS